ncbi:MAG: hypothetical protein ACPLZG_07435, partial [Thermoproteota archaeon]
RMEGERKSIQHKIRPLDEKTRSLMLTSTLLLFASLVLPLCTIQANSFKIEPTLMKVGPLERVLPNIPPGKYGLLIEQTSADAVTVALSRKNPPDANVGWGYGYESGSYYWIKARNDDYRYVDVYFWVTFWYY